MDQQWSSGISSSVFTCYHEAFTVTGVKCQLCYYFTVFLPYYSLACYKLWWMICLWRHSRSSWTRLWAIWHICRCPCSFQLSLVPTQTILWFYSMKCVYKLTSHIVFPPISLPPSSGEFLENFRQRWVHRICEPLLPPGNTVQPLDYYH